MADHRHKNANWMITNDRESRQVNSWAQVHAALLMDIRDELQQLNRVFACHNAQDIPNILRRIDKNTKKRPRKRKVKP